MKKIFRIIVFVFVILGVVAFCLNVSKTITGNPPRRSDKIFYFCPCLCKHLDTVYGDVVEYENRTYDEHAIIYEVVCLKCEKVIGTAETLEAHDYQDGYCFRCGYQEGLFVDSTDIS